MRQLPFAKEGKMIKAINEINIKNPKLTQSSICFAYILYNNTFNRNRARTSEEIINLAYKSVGNQIYQNNKTYTMKMIIGTSILAPVYIYISPYSIAILCVYIISITYNHRYKQRDMNFVLDIYSRFALIDNILPDAVEDEDME